MPLEITGLIRWRWENCYVGKMIRKKWWCRYDEDGWVVVMCFSVVPLPSFRSISSHPPTSHPVLPTPFFSLLLYSPTHPPASSPHPPTLTTPARPLTHPQSVEIFNGRVAMLATVGYAIQEAITGVPVIRESPEFFYPLFLNQAIVDLVVGDGTVL